MTETNDYYQEELQQLHQHFTAALEEKDCSIAEENTKEWHYVQRNFVHLLEGTASSMARLREQLDGELPKLYQSLLALYAPDALQSLPVMTVARLTTSREAMDYKFIPEATALNASTERSSPPACKFVTGSALEFLPLQISHCRLNQYQTEATQLVIAIDVLSAKFAKELPISALTFYVDEDEANAAGLLIALSEHIDKVAIRFDKQQATHTLHRNAVGLTAFKKDLVNVAGDGGQMNEALRNYFVYPRLYHFITVDESPDLEWPEDCSSFDIIINLNKPIDFFKKTEELAIYLNCVPCLNLHSIDCEPFTIDKTTNTYPLHIVDYNKDTQQLYGIHKVVALQHGQWFDRHIDSVTQQSWSSHDASYQWLADNRQQQHLLFKNTSEISERVISSSVFVENGELANQYLQVQRIFSIDTSIADNITANTLDCGTNYVTAPTVKQYETLFQTMLAIRFASSITLNGLAAFIMSACPGDEALALEWVNSITAINACDEICIKEYAQKQGINLCIYTNTKRDEASSYLFFKTLQHALCRKLPINYFLTINVVLLSLSTELYLSEIAGEENCL